MRVFARSVEPPLGQGAIRVGLATNDLWRHVQPHTHVPKGNVRRLTTWNPLVSRLKGVEGFVSYGSGF